MKVSEALEELKAIVGDETPCSASYEMTWWGRGRETKVTCEVWVGGNIRKCEHGNTFQEALDGMKYCLCGKEEEEPSDNEPKTRKEKK